MRWAMRNLEARFPADMRRDLVTETVSSLGIRWFVAAEKAWRIFAGCKDSDVGRRELRSNSRYSCTQTEHNTTWG